MTTPSNAAESTELASALEQRCSRQLHEELQPYLALLQHHYHSLEELQATSSAALVAVGVRAGVADRLLQALQGYTDRLALPCLPWWDKSMTAGNLRAAIAQLKQQYAGAAALQEYRAHAAVVAVFTSNEQEATLPAAFSEQETCSILEQAWQATDSSNLGSPSTNSWYAEGGSNQQEGRAQLLQHMRALHFLADLADQQQPLTRANLCQAHSILMAGAVDKDGVPITLGLRDHPAYAGTGWVYMRPGEVPEAVDSYLQRYEQGNAAAADAVELSAQLFYDLVHLVHPFSNGNGRLGRLLISYVLMRRGLPFPLPLVNGHRRPRKHYQTMVQKYSQLGRPTHLASFILECLHFRWRNFDKYVSRVAG